MPGLVRQHAQAPRHRGRAPLPARRRRRVVAALGAAALLALLAVLPATGKPAPLSVRLASRPPAVEAGKAWTATLVVRRGRRPAEAAPRLVARKGAARRSFRARPTGRGRYRARVALPSAGIWRLTAAAGGRTFALGRIAVRAAAVALRGPTGITRAPDGRILVADRESGRILQLDVGARRLRVVAVGLVQPTGLDVDAAGNIWVADDSGNAVVRIDPAGNKRRVAEIEGTLDVAAAPSGDVFVASRDSRLRRIDAGGTVRVYAGTGEIGHDGDGGPATQAKLFAPHGVSVDAAGNVLIADAYSVRRVDRVSGVITTVAGTGEPGFSGDGGPAAAARLSVLRLLPAADGSILIADTENHRLRRIGADGTIRTIAGSGDAAVLWPYDLAAADDGSVLVVEYQTPRIRRVDLATGAVETVVGPP